MLAALAWGGVRYGRGLVGTPPADGASGDKVALEFFTNPAPVPAISMKTIDGRTLSSADWRGKVVIVNFWATWCPPCRAEIPDLVALQAKYGDKLLIIGISEDEESPSVVTTFADQYHVNYPIVMLTPEIEHAFPGVYALPDLVRRRSRGSRRAEARRDAQCRHDRSWRRARWPVCPRTQPSSTSSTRTPTRS